MSVHLADFMIVRAAAFPESLLDDFGGRLRAGYSDAEYEAEISRERGLLFARTVNHPAFLKALYLANPAVAEKARPLTAVTPRKKRVRHLETTLYRYLSRAISRTVPGDLWSGVTATRTAEESGAEKTSPRYVFAPDLRIFQEIFAALARRPQMRALGRYFVNPTLRADATSEQLTYLAKTESGRVEARAIKKNRGAELIFAALGERRSTRDALIARVRAEHPVEEAALLRLFDQLLEAGALLGGPSFPGRYSTAWEALRRAARRLPASWRAQWSEASIRLRALADTLHASYATWSIDQVAATLEEARACVAQLIARLELPPMELPRVLFRADLILPYRVFLSHSEMMALLEHVRASEDYQARFGLGPAFRSSVRHKLRVPRALHAELDTFAREFLPTPSENTWSSIALAVNAGAESRERIAALEHILASPAKSIDLLSVGTHTHSHSSNPPVGCLLLSLRTNHAAGSRYVSTGLVDEPLAIYARHILLSGLRFTTNWAEAELTRAAEKANLTLYELARPSVTNPNAIARRALFRRTIDLWTGRPNIRFLRELTVSAAGADEPILIQRSGGRFVVVSADAAPHALEDPAARLLLLTGFHDAPAENIQASTVLFDVELSGEHSSPELTAGPLVVRSARTVLRGAVLRELLVERGSERFRRWLELSARLELAPRVSLRFPDQPPLVIPRDSPLALEAALEGARDESCLVVEAHGPSGFVAPDGERYAMELGVVFARSQHAWNGGAP